MKEKKVKTVRAKNLSMGGDISWHLLRSEITGNRVLVIEIEQRVLDGAVASMTTSVEDYVLAKGNASAGLDFLYGIYACERCATLVEQVGRGEDYESVNIVTYQKDEHTGESRYTGVKHWSVSHNTLSLRHDNKTYRFGEVFEEIEESEEAFA